MKVKVKRVEIFEGIRKDGSPNFGAKALVIFQDGCTAANLFIPDDVIAPSEVVKDGIYDMYRSEAGFVLVFDKISIPEERS